MSPGSSCYKSLIASCSTPFPKLPLLLSLGMWGSAHTWPPLPVHTWLLYPPSPEDSMEKKV
jgi:hypothetical protein